MKRREFAIGLALLLAGYLSQFTVATATRKAEPTRFTVRVENISNPEGMTASNGQKFPFALSPGMFVLSDKSAALFTEGKPARKNGLEMQAEDGDPSGLVASLVAMNHSSNLHGVFNTPVAAMAAGPIRPGDSYQFTVTAAPGMKLFMTQMFGQSNDWFYAPGPNGIALFDAKGAAVSGDVTDQLYLVVVPPPSGETPTVNVSSASVPVKKMTDIGADDFQWAEGGKTMTIAVRQSGPNGDKDDTVFLEKQ